MHHIRGYFFRSCRIYTLSNKKDEVANPFVGNLILLYAQLNTTTTECPNQALEQR